MNYQDFLQSKTHLSGQFGFEPIFKCLEETKCKWAMSEFNHPFILDQAKERNLNIIIIGERQNLKNRRIEILITNYENSQLNIF